MGITTSPIGRNLTDDNYYNVQGTYVNGVVTYAGAWGISAPAVAALVARRAEYEPLYLKSQDENTRTKNDVVAHRLIRKLYETELRTFHNQWIDGNSSISIQDKLILGGRERDTEPTPRGNITDIPDVRLKAVGGGSIEVRCQEETDETRPSMHPLADGVECRYILVPVGEMPPEGHEDAKKTLVSKKALFTIKCGDKQAGQRFYGFFRWTNLTNPANSGDWSPVQTVMIS